ncbi:MAG: hypothetical protein E7328_06490 [Clostridiales bacterium]|nr:hypothetical protein [Clostridiales bacterium]
MNHKIVRSYYKRLFYHNRTLFARALDFIALRLGLFFLLQMVFYRKFHRVDRALILSLITLCALSLLLEIIKERRFTAFVAKKQQELRQHYWLSRLTLLTPDDFRALCCDLLSAMGMTVTGKGENILFARGNKGNMMVFLLQCHPKYTVTPQDMLDLYHIAYRYAPGEVAIISTCPITGEAESFLHTLPFSVTILSREDLLFAADRAGKLPSYHETEQALIEELKKKEMSLRQLKTQALYSGKAKNYLICAGVLFFTMSYTGYHLYYTAAILGCLTLAAISYYNSRFNPGKKLRS